MFYKNIISEFSIYKTESDVFFQNKLCFLKFIFRNMKKRA